jgi:cyclophilin family peptidyl-prolyl cis-trans isomerase
MKKARGRSGLKPVAILAVLIASLLVAGCGGTSSTPEQPKPAAQGNVVIETDAGTIKVELLDTEAPKTAENFRLLVGRGFYDGVIFHRVVSGFMIQGGDPTGTGAGGQTATGGMLPNEVNLNSPLYQGGYKRGALAMANKGRPETGSSQFFIMHQNSALQPNYTIFGRVTEGIEVVDKIAAAPRSPGSERPVTPVKMNRVYIQ